MRSIINEWILITAVLLLAGCPNDYKHERETLEEKPPAVQMDDMFVSEKTEEGKTRTVFRTNDERYWTLEGKTIWTVWDETETEFRERAVAMGKTSGYSGGGYGIVFCHGEYMVKGILTPVMLVVMINNQGQYIIGKVIGGIFIDNGWWKTTPYLQRGTGELNEIRVLFEAENGEYCLEINEHEIERFRDDDEPTLSGGKDGYIVVITPFDKFPDSSVNVYFMEDR